MKCCQCIPCQIQLDEVKQILMYVTYLVRKVIETQWSLGALKLFTNSESFKELKFHCIKPFWLSPIN